MAKKSRLIHPDQPLLNHRPRTRREFIAQGFRAGTAGVMGMSLMSLLGRDAHALSPDMFSAFTNEYHCSAGAVSEPKIPCICFDLAGGANFAGSNVLVGGPGGQMDFLSTAGYQKLGLSPDILPSVDPDVFIRDDFGLRFHRDSALFAGMFEKASLAAPNTNGCVIPARSDNDTSNNPHNPMYPIYTAGARGGLLQLVGSRTSESGGNSMALLMDPELRPTKIDSPSDTRNLVEVGDLRSVIPDVDDQVQVLESMARISRFKTALSAVDTGLGSSADRYQKDRFLCEYVKAASNLERFSDPATLDPEADPMIRGGIFTEDEFDNEREFQKTASIMKLVIDGHAASGTVTMGGYDYHGNDRPGTDERDMRAGRCIGACLDYARRKGQPVMIYVFSDGSVSSNGAMQQVTIGDNTVEKGMWASDNSSTAASFFLVYDPGSPPVLRGANPDQQELRRQLGYMRPDASVETGSGVSASSSVDALVHLTVLNYLALHGLEGTFTDLFPDHGLGANYEDFIAFGQLSSVSGGIITTR